MTAKFLAFLMAVSCNINYTLHGENISVFTYSGEDFLMNVLAKLEENKAVCVGELLKGWKVRESAQIRECVK